MPTQAQAHIVVVPCNIHMQMKFLEIHLCPGHPRTTDTFIHRIISCYSVDIGMLLNPCRYISHEVRGSVPIPTKWPQDSICPSLAIFPFSRRPGYLWSYPLAKTFLWLRERTPLPKVLQVWPMFESLPVEGWRVWFCRKMQAPIKDIWCAKPHPVTITTRNITIFSRAGIHVNFICHC